MTLPDTPSGPHDDAEVAPEATAMLGLVFAVAAIVLLLLIPSATKPAPGGRDWYMQPSMWPLLSLSIMALPALLLATGLLRRRPGWLANGLAAFGDLGATVEFSVYFVVYLYVLDIAGFALSTLAFGQLCLMRCGLTTIRWALINLGFTAVLVLALRVGLDLWFPPAAIVDYLPETLADFVGTYL